MKNLFIILLIMSGNSIIAQDGKASTIKKTFSRTTSVQIPINASAEKVWELLSDATSHTSWNSTVISIDGTISQGEKIKLVSTLDPSRTFKLKIKEMVPNHKMIWGDAMGSRVYEIAPTDSGVIFSINEKIGGLMFPLFAGKIPPFDESFEMIAQDLKAAAEKK